MSVGNHPAHVHTRAHAQSTASPPHRSVWIQSPPYYSITAVNEITVLLFSLGYKTQLPNEILKHTFAAFRLLHRILSLRSRGYAIFVFWHFKKSCTFFFQFHILNVFLNGK